MSTASRLSGKTFNEMPPFISELSLGVGEDIETAVAPLREQIRVLQQELIRVSQVAQQAQQTAQQALQLAQRAIQLASAP